MGRRFLYPDRTSASLQVLPDPLPATGTPPPPLVMQTTVTFPNVVYEPESESKAAALVSEVAQEPQQLTAADATLSLFGTVVTNNVTSGSTLFGRAPPVRVHMTLLTAATHAASLFCTDV